MNITIVADVLGTENNGTTITIKRLINGLVERGHKLTVVSPYKDEQSQNPKYLSVDIRNFGIVHSYIVKNGVELGKPDKETIRNAIEGADIVHIELPFKMGKAAAKICQELDIPFTAGFHCQPENFSSHLGLKNSVLANKCLYLYYRNNFYKQVKHIHCPTQFIADELNKNNYTAKKYAISNGVVPTYKKKDVEKPEEFKDKYLVLFIGRMSKEKRHDLLIKAMKHSKYSDKIQLVFAGCGPLEEKVIKMGSKLKNPPIIGFYTKEELSDIINYCDLYCHPSDIEIEAISCIEALTCGLVPVISNSPRSATRFFAQDERSLFKVGDAKDLAKKIDYWIEHGDEKEQMSDVYIEYAKRFNIDSCIDQMVEMFNEAIEEHKNIKKSK